MEGKKVLRRLISMLLCCLLMLGIVSVTAFAAPGLTILNEISIESKTTSAEVGKLPDFQASTTTKHASIHDKCWVRLGLLGWEKTNNAYNDGARYGICLEVKLSRGCEMDRNARILFNDAPAGGFSAIIYEGRDKGHNYYFVIIDLGCVHTHIPGDAVKENEVAPTCTEDGSHDEVVYCKTCKKELSRKTVTDTKLGHAIQEKWSSDENKHWHECTRCEYKEDEGTHIPGEAVKENEVAPTCTEDGSHDEVVYCKECERELSRKTVTDPKLGHKWGKWYVARSATKYVEGLMRCDCENCGEYKLRVIPKLSSSEDKEEESNPNTGAPVSSEKYVSAISAIAVLAGAAYAVEKIRKS